MTTPAPASADPADATLVQAVAAGSESALAALYDRHARMVFQVALRVTSDRSVAEEVVQDAFLTLWNRAELYDPELGELRSWLAVVARNRALNRVRARMRRIPAQTLSAVTGEAPDAAAMLDWLIADAGTVATATPEAPPDVQVVDLETASELARVVHELPEPERAVLLLAYREGLSQTEIADRLGWPLGTVKTRTRRALARLRTTLDAGPAPAVRREA
jgi:RNA polymerase sigma-70 factor (ECF subfamily)